NAAAVVLNGGASRIVNQTGQDALANLEANAAAGSLTFLNGRACSVAQAFANAGTLAAGAGVTCTFRGPVSGGGTVRLAAGASAEFLQGGSTSGLFDAEVGGTFRFVGGTFTLNAGARVAAPASVEVTAATLALNTSITVATLRSAGTITGTGDL